MILVCSLLLIVNICNGNNDTTVAIRIIYPVCGKSSLCVYLAIDLLTRLYTEETTCGYLSVELVSVKVILLFTKNFDVVNTQLVTSYTQACACKK